MLGLLRTRPHFRRLWAAGAISLVGDWLSFVAISLLTMRNEKSAIALGVMFMVTLLPRAMMSPFAGVLADRIDRRRILVGASLLQAALTAAMVAAAASASIRVLFALMLVRAAASSLVTPAEAASIPRVVEESEIGPANALLSSMWSVTYILGMALGGILAQLGPTLAIALDGATFIAAALLAAGLPPLVPTGAERDPPRDGRGGRAFARVGAELRDAWRTATARPELLRALFAKSLLALATTTGWVVLNVVAGSEVLGPAALSLGALQAVRGAGTGFGPVLFERLARGGAPYARLLDASFVVGLGAVIAFTLVRSPLAIGVLAFLWGTGSGANWVVSSTVIQKTAPDAVLGRVTALDDLALTLVQSASAVGGAAMVDRVGNTPAVGVVAFLSATAWIGLTVVATLRVRPAQGDPTS